jgi:type IV secretion system pilin
MSLKNIKIFTLFILTCLILPVKNVLANGGLETARGAAGLPGGAGGTGIATILGNLAGAALALSGSIFLFLIIYGGILIMTAAGKQEQVQKGKNVIIWAIIGALILGSAYAITSIVFSVVGAQ